MEEEGAPVVAVEAGQIGRRLGGWPRGQGDEQQGGEVLEGGFMVRSRTFRPFNDCG